MSQEKVEIVRRAVQAFEEGDWVAAAAPTDTALRQPMGVVFSDFRQGRTGRFDAYQTWREALEAAGLSE